MSNSILVIGDLVTLAVLTFIGFATHGEVGASYLPRMGVTFASLAVGWFALAPALGLFDRSLSGDTRQLWRPALSAFFAAQFAVNLRGLLLGSDVQPVFAIVLGTTAALGMTAWRWLAGWLARRGDRSR